MKRAIAAIGMPDIVPGEPPTAPPVFMMVKPEELLVDASYQRDLSEASVRLIRRIVAEWDWRKFKSPTVAMTDEGPVVLDGQHTATAAASHPLIAEIPVLLVDAPEAREQAQAFVGLNTTRLGMTAAQIHAANLAAGDEAALAIDRVCRTAGMKVLRLPPSGAHYKPGETIAVAAIGSLIARHGEEITGRILAPLAQAEFGPVSAHHMRAVEQLITDPEFAEFEPEELARIIPAIGIDAAERDARTFAATHCVPKWRGLAAVWFKARKGKRKPPAASPQSADTSPEAVEPTEPPKALRPLDAVAKNVERQVDTAAVEANAGAAKRDQRPERNGWVPGPLMKRCASCDCKFIGGMKATTCADCAYGRRA